MLEKKFNEVLARYDSYSLHEILKIRFLISVLVASWFIIFKLEIVNYKLRTI
jgi:hypothetical protein